MQLMSFSVSSVAEQLLTLQVKSSAKTNLVMKSTAEKKYCITFIYPVLDLIRSEN